MGGAVVTRRGGVAIAAVLAVAALGISPRVAGAVDEQRTQVLPGDATTAVVADVDGDGANELVRILDERPAARLVEAWGHDGEGWRLLGSAPIPSLPLPNGEGEPLMPHASSLLVWQADGRARVLVLARPGGPIRDDGGFACCVGIFALDVRGGSLAMHGMPAQGTGGDLFQVADLDADGTDEIVAVAGNLRGDASRVEVLRWKGEAFVSIFALEGDEPIWGFLVGDSDGSAGDDLVAGPTPSGQLRRIAWVDGAVVVDEAVLDPRALENSVSALADGQLVVSLPDELRTVRWPRGEDPVTTAALGGRQYPYPWVFGTGPATLLALQDGPFSPSGMGSLAIYDAELRPVAVIEPTAAAVRVTELFSVEISTSRGMERYLYPWSGPMRGATPGRPDAFVWGGVLITAGEAGHETQPISPMVGRRPIGLAGPNDAWVALGGDFINTGDIAYLYDGTFPAGYGSISLTPVSGFLSEERAADPTFALREAVALGSSIERATEILASGPFEVAVGAPRGSWVTAWDGRHLQELTVTESSVSVEFAPPARPKDEDADLRATILVTTPDGHVTIVDWVGAFVREPPELSVAGTTDVLSLSARLEGSVGPRASLTVDGRSVIPGSDGRFAASVEALPWPRRVEVVARDPLGNETVERIEVVGLVDYRGLPWTLILGLATLGAGAGLFLRVPRRRSPATILGGDARLEELDPIDGTGLERR